MSREADEAAAIVGVWIILFVAIGLLTVVGGVVWWLWRSS